MQIYDTAAQRKVELDLGPVVRMYTCGITPYDAAHIGHASVYLTFDLLQRRLRDLGHQTLCVRNVTDVDDDILRKSRELGVFYLDLAASEMAKFDKSMNALEVVAPHSEPRATSAISEILTLVDQLMSRGHAYRSGGSVYYDVTTAKDFGKISHYSLETMLELAAERGGKPEDSNKRNPLDFILWQESAPGEPSWDSRWGSGRPGWHIECSALAMRDLGETIDIHGGGSDLIFPHHECEAAQAESVTEKTFSRYWMHVGMVNLDGVKMSKSLGNLVFVGDLVEMHDPRVVRLAIISNHYRHPWEWRDELISVAERRLSSIIAAGVGDGALDEVRRAMDNDLDIPTALQAIDIAIERGEGVSRAAELLGVRI